MIYSQQNNKIQTKEKSISQQIKQEYNNIRAFLKEGRFPNNFASTKSNFKRKAKRYTLNASGRLMRKNLPVVLHSERKRIFDGQTLSKLYK